MKHGVPSHAGRSRTLYRALSVFCLFAVAASGLLVSQTTQRRGRKYTPPPPTSAITVTVVKAANGKPVENAAVVFHPMKDGKDEGGLELKTNEEGKVSIDVVPIGDTVRLQIIANGYQTFGDDYPITTDSKEITVKLKPPDKQYSIYEKHDTTKEQGGAHSSDDRVTQPSQKPQPDQQSEATKPQS